MSSPRHLYLKESNKTAPSFAFKLYSGSVVKAKNAKELNCMIQLLRLEQTLNRLRLYYKILKKKNVVYET